MIAFCEGVATPAHAPGQTVTNRYKPLAPCWGCGSCPPERRPLRDWLALGLVPPGLPPCAIAAALTRLTGRPPARDPQRRARTYSADELRLALAELGRSPRPAAPPPPPPADPLALVWAAALRRLELPSTRMLLSQQARLVALRHSSYACRGPGELVALVAVASGWLPVVASRRDLIGNALGEVLGRPVAVELRGVAQ